MRKNRTLYVYMGQERVAKVHGLAGQLDVLEYAQGWQRFSLSASLPLAVQRHEGKKVTSWLWNLVPESPVVLDALQRKYKMSDMNDVLCVLEHLGEDTPGALAFVTEDTAPRTPVELVPISVDDIASELRELRELGQAPVARVSLAGAQPKTAYVRLGDEWFRPEGAMGSTHIVKPAMSHSADADLVEHVLARTARRLGIDAVESEVLTFNDERAYVTRRYDREVLADGTVARLHQEDLCQALGRSRVEKYQQHGGPTAVDLVKTVRELCPSDEQEVWRRLAFNVAVGNADAHAKNYSFLIDETGFRLAPAYDLVSLAAYPDFDQRLAMAIGKEYRYREVNVKAWKNLARRTNTDEDSVFEVVQAVNSHVQDALEETVHEEGVEGNPKIEIIRQLVTEPHVKRLAGAINGTTRASEENALREAESVRDVIPGTVEDALNQDVTVPDTPQARSSRKTTSRAQKRSQ